MTSPLKTPPFSLNGLSKFRMNEDNLRNNTNNNSPYQAQPGFKFEYNLRPRSPQVSPVNKNIRASRVVTTHSASAKKADRAGKSKISPFKSIFDEKKTP